jgi:hypothetical protein
VTIFFSFDKFLEQPNLAGPGVRGTSAWLWHQSEYIGWVMSPIDIGSCGSHARVPLEQSKSDFSSVYLYEVCTRKCRPRCWQKSTFMQTWRRMCTQTNGCTHMCVHAHIHMGLRVHKPHPHRHTGVCGRAPTNTEPSNARTCTLKCTHVHAHTPKNSRGRRDRVEMKKHKDMNLPPEIYWRHLSLRLIYMCT